MKKILLFTLLTLTLHSYSQTTSVPDVEFEKYLEANSMGNGVTNDGLVLTSNINTVTELNITDLDINDLTGIEDFLALEKLEAEFVYVSKKDINELTQRQNNPKIPTIEQ